MYTYKDYHQTIVMSMSTNIKVKRVCENCGNEFTARTTTTKYCSHTCNCRHYKKKEKELKSGKNVEATKTRTKAATDINAKEFLTVRDISVLLGCSLRTAYRLVNNGTITGINLAERMTRINRSELNRLLSPQHSTVNPTDKVLPLSSYTMSEIQQKFGISHSALSEVIKRNDIPKTKRGRFTYVPKGLIDKLLT